MIVVVVKTVRHVVILVDLIVTHDSCKIVNAVQQVLD